MSKLSDLLRGSGLWFCAVAVAVVLACSSCTTQPSTRNFAPLTVLSPAGDVVLQLFPQRAVVEMSAEEYADFAASVELRRNSRGGWQISPTFELGAWDGPNEIKMRDLAGTTWFRVKQTNGGIDVFQGDHVPICHTTATSSGIETWTAGGAHTSTVRSTAQGSALVDGNGQLRATSTQPPSDAMALMFCPLAPVDKAILSWEINSAQRS